jgi:hypothetical protein
MKRRGGAADAVAQVRARRVLGPSVVRRFLRIEPGFSEWDRLIALPPTARVRILEDAEMQDRGPSLSEMLERA